MPGAASKPVDVLLIFPPQTEARFFPYLSLPYLTGHLRRCGRRMHQADLNIALLHDLVAHPSLLDTVTCPSGDGLGGWYRRAMAEVFAEHIDQVSAHVMAKEPPGELGAFRSFLLAGHAIELLVRDTFLTRTWADLGQLDGDARQAAERPPRSLGLAVERLYGMVEQLLTRHRPAVVGLSVAFFSQLGPALLIAAWVRRLAPDAKICLGGQQVMLRHADLARLPGVRDNLDALCLTAGEQPLERWLDALDGSISIAQVPGMTWLPRVGGECRTGPTATLRFSDLGPPDFDGLPFRSYLNETMELAIISCVGCYWGRCAFCAYGNRSREPGSYQQGTVTQIADAVQAVVASTGAKFLAIVDENTNLRLIVKAMRLARSRGVQVQFGVRSRLEPSLADPDFCRSLADAGCAMIAAGYEGTSQRLLDLMDRGVRAADYQQIVDNLTAAGIVLRLAVMGQVFNETEAEFAESMRFLAANEKRIGIDALELMVAEPGSRLVRHPGAYGLSLDTSGPLAGNPELSYLSGRVGYSYAVEGGPTREQALDRLKRVFRDVNPGMASASRPSRAMSGPELSAVDAVVPHPWVRPVPAELDAVPDRIAIADLVWEQIYALPRRDVDQGTDGLLTALSPPGRRLLARLVAAGAGTQQHRTQAGAVARPVRSPS